MGSEWEWTTERGNHHLAEIKHYGYIIDILQSIKVSCKLYKCMLHVIIGFVVQPISA